MEVSNGEEDVSLSNKCNPVSKPLPSSFRDRTTQLFLNGFLSANEYWDSKRLRYNLKSYGCVKPEKLVDSLTQTIVSTPFSPVGVVAHRNNALKTLSNVIISSTLWSRFYRVHIKSTFDVHQLTRIDPALMKLPAGTIATSPHGLDLPLKTRLPFRPRYDTYPCSELQHGSLLLSAPVGVCECTGLNEMGRTYVNEFSEPSHSAVLVRGSQEFFPSSSTSQISKSRDQADGVTDKNCTLNFRGVELHDLDSPPLVKGNFQSRLSSLRPPPLDLRESVASQIDEEPVLAKVEGNRSNSPNVEACTPCFIRQLESTEAGVTPPPTLVMPPTEGRYRNGPLKFIQKYFRRTQQLGKICRQVNDDMLDYRPFFTYMVCFIHVLVVLFACIRYGFAPVGFNLERLITRRVLMPSLDVEMVCRVQDENIWIGPQQIDLIRIGARYSPCMRSDETLNSVVVEAQKEWDRRSGCCINKRDSTCYQTSRLFCSRSTSTWLHNADSSPTIRTFLQVEAQFANESRQIVHDDGLNRDYGLDAATTAVSSTEQSLLVGPVCGLDPEFCVEPRSTGPFQWSRTDVTDWPICTRPVNTSSLAGFAAHMYCEVVARPCCVGIKGECIITTPFHCDFLQGRFHPEARLCSQVRCLQEVCGMVPFISPDTPDQISRLLISLFLHAGIVHLALSLFIQLTVMRNLEKLLGCFRIAAIFLLSGCFSGLTSGIMLPYHVHTGPTGAHFALFGVSLMDSLQTIDIFISPWSVLLKQIAMVVTGFFIGFLPWLDNYAHMSGFVSGILLAFVFVPYLGCGNKSHLTAIRVAHLSSQAPFDDADREVYQRKLAELTSLMKWRKVRVILACLTTWVLLFSTLLVVFIKWPLTNCPWCKYFNCLPWTPELCESLEVNVHTPTRCINPRT